MVKESLPAFAPSDTRSGPDEEPQIPKFTESSERPGSRTMEILSRTLYDWETQCAHAEAHTRNLISGSREITGPIDSEKLLKGGIVNWRNFRQYLLDLGTHPILKMKEIGDYYLHGESVDEENRILARAVQGKPKRGPVSGIEGDLPSFLASWVAFSRRAFCIPEHLQKIFTNDDYGDLTWEDVPLPFNAFAIEFNPPLWWDLGQGKGYYFECAIVSLIQFRENPDPYIGVRVFLSDKNRKTLHDYSRDDRKVFEDALKKVAKGKQIPEYFEWLAKKGKILDGYTLETYQNMFPAVTIYIDPKKQIEEISEQEDPIRKVMNRIIAGCCLHLAYFDQGQASVPLPPLTPEPVRKKKKKIDPRGLISDLAKIFVLQGVNVQGKSQRHGDESTGRTLRPHWRKGFLRRERNSPPGSPKTEWVRPTKVNAHLVLPGTLPIGSATILSNTKRRRR